MYPERDKRSLGESDSHEPISKSDRYERSTSTRGFVFRFRGNRWPRFQFVYFVTSVFSSTSGTFTSTESQQMRTSFEQTSAENQLVSERDILSARTLGASTFGVGHALTFTEIIEIHSLKTRRVEKQVFASSSVNKTKSLIGDSFDRTLCHLFIPKRCLGCEPDDSAASVLSNWGAVYRVKPVLARSNPPHNFFFSRSPRLSRENTAEMRTKEVRQNVVSGSKGGLSVLFPTSKDPFHAFSNAGGCRHDPLDSFVPTLSFESTDPGNYFD